MVKHFEINADHLVAVETNERRGTGDPPASNGWTKYEEYVLRELKRQSTQQDKLMECLSGVKSDISGLKARAGMWGAVAGILGASAVGLAIKMALL